LGHMYEGGNGVHRDPVKAAEFYSQAAEHGLVTAQIELAGLYLSGKGVQDNFEAAKWFRRAAEQGHPVGENAIGYMYWSGKGVGRDYREAADWFQRAAEQDYALAQFNLGVLYQNGLGVPLNYAEAYKWFTLAAKNGYNHGRRALEALKQIMTKAQVRDGQERVADWVSHHPNSTLAAQKAETKELDSYAAVAQP